MKNCPTPPDLDAILGGLKDFQRDTVDYVFRRLYEDEDAAHRFLIADETGLGKTLVARGVIAKAIDHLREKVPRIDVLYICSNADIARQNINRLNVTGRQNFPLASRLTLLPTIVHDLKNNNSPNFVSFTPGTAFELGNTMGRQDERALLYHLLQDTWDFGGKKAPLNVLQGNTGTYNFHRLVARFGDDNNIDDTLADQFTEALEQRIAQERRDGHPDIRSRFEELCKRFRQSRKHLPPHDITDRKRIVGELRGLLATACLEALEPDIIILDEFQRFKHLLDGTDSASKLARGLFEYAGAKTILLSATPYKMYTLAHESAEDDHYADFLRTLDFLEFGGEEAGELEEILEEYRRALLRLGEGGAERARDAKRRLETRLKRVMVRTEKLAASEDRDGMLKEVPTSALKLESLDLEGYLSLRRVSRVLGVGDALEYWKSAPYLLNFMDGYKLKQKFAAAIDRDGSELTDALRAQRGLLLPWEDVVRYAEVDPANARLRALLADTVDAGAWQLLWLPPSLPYYRLEGPFADPALKSFTKRLVFSSWKVAPKAVAAMVSYEAERLMIRSFEEEPENSPEARQRRGQLLQLSVSEGRLTGMPVLGILYPCVSLAEECDPLLFGAGKDREPPAAREVVEWAERHVEGMLREIGTGRVRSGAEDESWYWAAPILFDLRRHEEATRRWFSRPDLAEVWSDGQRGEEEGGARWADHVGRARALVEGEISLGKPPEDLARVIATAALASPGTASLRALRRVAGGDADPSGDLRVAAARVAWHLRSLLNSPEATWLLRDKEDMRKPYWKSALEYCVAGCLQAALDEYAHVLRESQGLLDASAAEIADEISRAMCVALGIRASSMTVDEVHVLGRSATVSTAGTMRGHFAMRFAGDRADDGSEKTRTSQVRESFNSPFWPFVVITTSVGQEGLDFHTYGHAVMHWNLPANPVDLEQREGRVHRYKGHAVRKNLALTYGLTRAEDGSGDPWQGLFAAGKRDRHKGATDLVPFWIYPIEGGAKIERHVPALPLSRDRDRIAALRRSLAAYRMVFGQARQEDLLSYLLVRLPEEEIPSLAEELCIDLEPPQRGKRAKP